MAVAIRLERMLRSGEVADLTELARLGHVTQPRMSQIMILTLLAPDIQEELLFLPRVTSVAGFEWGTGFYINPVTPEEAAEILVKASLTPPVAEPAIAA